MTNFRITALACSYFYEKSKCYRRCSPKNEGEFFPPPNPLVVISNSLLTVLSTDEHAEPKYPPAPQSSPVSTG